MDIITWLAMVIDARFICITTLMNSVPIYLTIKSPSMNVSPHLPSWKAVGSTSGQHAIYLTGTCAYTVLSGKPSRCIKKGVRRGCAYHFLTKSVLMGVCQNAPGAPYLVNHEVGLFTRASLLKQSISTGTSLLMPTARLIIYTI